MLKIIGLKYKITKLPDFKGYINDVGGPTANFRYPSCDRQKEAGVCPNKKCLSPTPCKFLKVDHSEYTHLLSEIEKIDGVKKYERPRRSLAL